jgi:hypothetical protein
VFIMSTCTLLIRGAHIYNHAHISSKMMSVISDLNFFLIKGKSSTPAHFSKKIMSLKFMESCTTLH